MVWLVTPRPLLDLVEAGEDYRPFMENRVVAGQPLDFPGAEVVALSPRSRLKLPEFEVDRPSVRYLADIEQGQLSLRPLE